MPPSLLRAYGTVADPGSRWVRGQMQPPSPPKTHAAPAATSPFLLSTCLGHRPEGRVAVRVPHQRLGHCVIIPPKTKGYLRRPAARLRGTQCHEAGRPVDWGLPITCPLYVNERQGASVFECVWVYNLEVLCQTRKQETKTMSCVLHAICVCPCVTEREGRGAGGEVIFKTIVSIIIKWGLVVWLITGQLLSLIKLILEHSGFIT